MGAVRKAIRDRYESRALLATDSGTAALTLALGAAKRRAPGRPVALPAYCCYDVATAADGAGVDVLLYDLDPGSLAPDYASLRRSLDLGAAAIVVAHLYGIPVPVPDITGLADEYGAMVIEDAAQGAGAALRNRPLGCFGSLGVLSFGRGKGVTAGRGGALLANDAAGMALLPRDLGRSSRGWRDVPAVIGQWMFARPGVYGIPSALPFLRLGESVYRKPDEPCPQSRFSAGVLKVTCARAAREAVVRRRNALRLLRRLEGNPALRRMAVGTDATAGHLRLPVLRESHRERSDPKGRRFGIMPGYPTTLARLRPFASAVRNLGDGFPGSEDLARRLLTLPTHGRLTERDLRKLEEWIDGQGARLS